MGDLRPAELAPSYDVVNFLAPGVTADMTTCDREPIHLCGAIQPHGVLLGVREDDLTVRLASANTGAHLGAEPPAVLGAPLTEVGLGAEPVAKLRAALADPRASGFNPLACELPGRQRYELTWHRIDELVVVELEPADVAGVASTTDVFADAHHAIQAMEHANGVKGLCDTAAEEIRHLTAYDRVMIYHFHPDWHGEVIAESREPELEPFLGLEYPASDIPRQARKLYLLNRLRAIADVGYDPVPLLGAPDVDAQALNLSLSDLRSVSPFHLAYLTNMGVGATLTISVMRGTRLWGMVACHHRTPKRVDAQLRSACRLVGQVLSMQAVTQYDRERDAHRTAIAEVQRALVARMSGAESLAEALVTGPPSPVALTGADGVVARIDGQTASAGIVPPAPAVDALLARLCADDEPSELICDDLPHRFTELEPFSQHAAGVIAVAVSAAYEDFILWFRGETVRTVRWAGNPDKPMTGDPAAPAGEPTSVALGPRLSFDTWTQEVSGHGRPWLPAEIDAGRALARAIPKLQLAHARDELARLALRDPLTGLPNRALLLACTAQALTRRKPGAKRVALLFIDLDHFESVDELYGHAGGDEILLQAAERLGVAVSHSDTVARAGDDEFLVLCEATTPDQVGRLSNRIVEAFRTPFLVGDQEALVTVSIGVAVAVAGNDATPAELLRHADTAMNRAKRAGRNVATTPLMA